MRVSTICVLTVLMVSFTSSEIPSQLLDYPQSLERELATLLEAQAQRFSDHTLLLKLADLYLDIGNDLFTDPKQRLVAYKEGARFAQRALELQEDSAEAHFLYAANLGEAAALKGVVQSFLSVNKIRFHVMRALELKKDHVPALHMAGMMLEELPRLMGGNPEAALDYVKRAVTLNPTYTEARLNLAKMYLKRNTPDLAKQELLAITNMDHPNDPYAWVQHHRPEAVRILDSLRHTK